MAARALEKLDEVLRHARSFIGESDTKTVVDFGHLCADLVAILDPMSRIRVSYPEAHILVEAVALQVELRNILDNAIKHARSRILIELKQSDAAENMLEVRVSDDGPGFVDPDSALNLAKPATAGPDKGFGLETVARLATSRGGKVWIGEPELGKGATICWTHRRDHLSSRCMSGRSEIMPATPALPRSPDRVSEEPVTRAERV